ncbi:MAG: hypothetical protein PHP45_02760 [Elusimicrobiales bacterium]|nr:hypothetical protein [Elusimicrobiales bacterium]
MTTPFETLSLLTENRNFAGYAVRAVYTDHRGKPLGARFIHDCGMPVDLLYFNSLPQLSVCFQTLPETDMGEAHALEHIVLGKGRKGKYLSVLFDMCLAENTAATYPELTNYQFSCAGGTEAFWRLAAAFFDALLEPDFSDEEVRGEVYSPGAVLDRNGGCALEEKGTVYNEMLSASEKPMTVLWRKLAKTAYGAGHPLARESGGDPAEMRKLTPERIRAFHRDNYRFNSRASLVAAMPYDISPQEFLEKLSGIISRAPSCSAAPEKPFPDFQSAPEPELWLGRYPSADENAPQDAVFAWKPRRRVSYRKAAELSLFLDVLAGGETSYLYRDLVDSSARKYDSGAVATGYFLDDEPSNLPGIFVSGIPAANVGGAALEALRGVITARIAALRSAKGAELEEMRGKAVSLLSSRRRSMLKFLDNPPRFGDRHGGIAWHKHAQALETEGGFLRPVAQLETLASIEAEVRADAGFWGRVAEEAGLLRQPYACAVKPDGKLLLERSADKKARLAAALRELELKHSAKGAAALALQYAEGEAAARRLERELAPAQPPAFIENPPLTLDDKMETRQTVIPCGVKAAVSSAGETPFTDITLFFDLNALGRDELIYAPALAGALSGTGVKTPSGEILDYSAMIERWRAEIFSLGAFTASNPHTGRLELCLNASAASAEEIPAAAEWLENCLLRNLLSSETAGRLKDIAEEGIQDIRNMMSRPEEYWMRDVAGAFFHAADARWMSVYSPFTELFHLERLRLMLENPPEKEKLIACLAGLSDGAKPESALVEIGALSPWLAQSLSWNIEHFPAQTGRADLGELARAYAAALAAGPQAAVGGMKRALSGILRRGGARAAVTGSPENAEKALALLDALLARLPEGAGRAAPARGENSILARVSPRTQGLKRLVHGALINRSGSGGAAVLRADGPSYSDTGGTALWDFLAVKFLSGGGPHALFMKTWDAGLAYSNGINANPATGKINYYAERCPDLVRTLAFVSSAAAQAKSSEKYHADYALSNSFSDYRGGDTTSARGYAAASDMADGITPAVVRRFKSALLAAAKKPDAPEKMNARLLEAAGRVMIVQGKPLSAIAGAQSFVCAPPELAERYALWLAEQGETEPVARLYPRDFWIF